VKTHNDEGGVNFIFCSDLYELMQRRPRKRKKPNNCRYANLNNLLYSLAAVVGVHLDLQEEKKSWLP
jgi:hypothetical protein